MQNSTWVLVAEAQPVPVSMVATVGILTGLLCTLTPGPEQNDPGLPDPRRAQGTFSARQGPLGTGTLIMQAVTIGTWETGSVGHLGPGPPLELTGGKTLLLGTTCGRH